MSSGASIPNETRLPASLATVMTMLSPIAICSPSFLLRTNKALSLRIKFVRASSPLLRGFGFLVLIWLLCLFAWHFHIIQAEVAVL